MNQLLQDAVTEFPWKKHERNLKPDYTTSGPIIRAGST